MQETYIFFNMTIIYFFIYKNLSICIWSLKSISHRNYL